MKSWAKLREFYKFNLLLYLNSMVYSYLVSKIKLHLKEGTNGEKSLAEHLFGMRKHSENFIKKNSE